MGKCIPAYGKLKQHYYEQGVIVKDAIKLIRIEDGLESRDESSDMSENGGLSGMEATV